jgi:hypothetical protein
MSQRSRTAAALRSLTSSAAGSFVGEKAIYKGS